MFNIKIIINIYLAQKETKCVSVGKIRGITNL